MPEVRLIDANALKAKLKIGTNTATYSDYCNGYCDARQVDLDAIDAAPTIEAEPVRHGRWVETEPDEDDRKIGIEFSIKCSRCHNENSHLDFNEIHEITGKTFWKSRFCPNCGARMDGGADS